MKCTIIVITAYGEYKVSLKPYLKLLEKEHRWWKRLYYFLIFRPDPFTLLVNSTFFTLEKPEHIQ